MEFSEDTLFEGVTVKRGDEDAPAVGEVLIYEQRGAIGVRLISPDGEEHFSKVWIP